MDKRPFWSRISRLPTFLVRAVKEAHAVIVGIIGGVVFLLATTLGPWLLNKCFPSLSLSQPSPVTILCGLVVIVLAILLVGGCLVWEEEEHQHMGLREHYATLTERFKPRLTIEFDPQAAKFITRTQTTGGINMIYIRVNVRALSPHIGDCLAHLERISYWNGTDYTPLFDEHLRIPWASENPKQVAPKALNHDADALLDVAWLAQPNSPLGFSFGILNAESNIPTSMKSILRWMAQNPTANIKLDVLVTAEDSESARISLNIHRGGQWDQAQIGWMKGLAIIINQPNYLTDLTPVPRRV